MVTNIAHTLTVVILATTGHLFCPDAAARNYKYNPSAYTNDYISLSLSRNHSCAITRDNLVYCWGRNQYGQLGDGTTTDSPRPVRVRTHIMMTALSTGAGFTCGLSLYGNVLCWGTFYTRSGGQVNSRVPVPLSTEFSFSQITSSDTHSCAIDTMDVAWCWGKNSHGQLGRGSFTSSAGFSEVEGLQFERIAAGEGHTCGLTLSGALYCWGNNNYGQLGIGSLSDEAHPARVNFEGSFYAVAAGEAHTCAIDTEGGVWCWGMLNPTVSPVETAATPRLLEFPGGILFPAASLVARGEMTCVEVLYGERYCWGRNDRGQLGTGTTNNSFYAPLLSRPEQWKHSYFVQVGGEHACGLDDIGDGWCWGANDNGQLGDDTQDDSLEAVMVYQRNGYEGDCMCTAGTRSRQGSGRLMLLLGFVAAMVLVRRFAPWHV